MKKILLTSVFAIVCLALVKPGICADDLTRSWDSLVLELRSHEVLSASLVGFVSAPSEAYALYETIIAEGDRAKFHAMLADESPVVRCVGLLALARTCGREAVPALEGHLSDGGMLMEQWHDEMGDMTVAQFALRLLHDSNALDLSLDKHEAAPLLSQEQLTSLYFEILATDSMTCAHDSAASRLVPLFREKEATLDLSALKTAAARFQLAVERDCSSNCSIWVFQSMVPAERSSWI